MPADNDPNKQRVLVVTSPPWGHISIKKSSGNTTVTANNSEYSLEGAEYALYKDPAGTIPVNHIAGAPATFTIDANGFSTIVHTVPAGTYYLKETKAPKGYILDSEPHPVTIPEAGSLQTEVSDNPYVGAIKVIKKDLNTGQTVPMSGFKFKLYKSGTNTQVGEEQTTGDDGMVTFSNLPLGDYEVLETAAVTPYKINTTRVPVSIDQQANKSDGTIAGATEPSTGVKTIVVTSVSDGTEEEPEKIEASVIKVWNDSDNKEGKRPTSISVQLKADNVAYGDPVTLNEGNNWRATVGNLPKHDDNGQEISYTWSEVESGLPDGYELTNTSVNGTVTTLTNSYETTSIPVTVAKVWKDATGSTASWPEGKTVSVQLLADGQPVAGKTAELSSSKTSYTFTDLPKFRDDGTTPITYSVKELTVAGYVSEVGNISNGTITITNTPETTSATVKKVWNDANNAANKRPAELTVNLMANNEATGKHVTLNEGNGWQDTISNLPAKDGANAIVYTWSEDALPDGYTLSDTSVNGTITTLTNSYDTTEIPVTVTKVWKDATGSTASWPEGKTVSVQLLADGQPVAGKTADLSSSKASHTFTDLPKFRDDGTTPITYSVEELTVAGYVSEVGNISNGTITITNTPETTSLTVDKKWVNANGTDSWPSGKTVSIQLTADGSPVSGKTATLSATKTSHTFDNLAKYKSDGTTEIKYSVKEVSIAGYSSKIGDPSNGKVTITNTQEEVSATVKKVWNDSNDKLHLRPESIKVKLSNGTSVTLNEGNSWQATVNNLPKYDDNGNEVSYTWSEDEVPAGYKLTGNSKDGTVTTLTNTANVPGIGTKLATSDGGNDILVTKSMKTITLTDTISYTNLVPGRKYQMRGQLHRKDGTDGGTAIESTKATKDFTPEKANGTVSMSFTLDVSDITTDVVAFEELYMSDTLVTDHKDINDTNQTVHVHRPNVGTKLATVDGEKELLVPLSGNITLTDVVSYSGLVPNKEYTLTGAIHAKDGDTDKGAVGTEVTKKFTPTAASGTVEMTFTIDPSAVDVSSVVAFERLSIGTDLLAEHEDINDTDQTVTIRRPNLKTKFADVNGSQTLIKSNRKVTVTDHVDYSGLIPNKEYELKASVHIRKEGADGGVVKGTEVTKKFTPSKESGTETIEIVVDLSSFEGDAIVAFEELYQNGVLIGTHSEITDKDQTIEFTNPSIGTKLATASGDSDAIIGIETKTIELVDTVSYRNLVPGQEYVMRGSLHTKNDDGTDGGVIDGSDGETSFTPKEKDGTIEVKMTIDVSSLNGNSAVAFEELLYDGQVITTHEDINDEGQTVRFHKPSIGTTLMTEDGKKTTTNTGKVTLVDTVEYHDLVPGKEYVLRGEIHRKGASGDAGVVTGTPTSVKFTPTTEDGKTEVRMTVDASGSLGTIVAFEELYLSVSDESGAHEEKIAEHKDINDSKQSISVTDASGDKVASNNRSNKVANDLLKTGDAIVPVTTGVLVAGASVLAYARSRRKKA